MRILLFLVCCAFMACSSGNTETKSDLGETGKSIPEFTPSPQALVYKTKEDYSNLVPVILSEDKSEIVSYPHPSDVKVGDNFPFPTQLSDGYLLDNRGIGKNVAFLKLTYEEYSELQKVPSLKELYDNIIDLDPLIELCDCGLKSEYTNIQEQINELINNDKLRTDCKAIK